MTFKIEFSDQRFRLVAPDGDCEEAVGFCSVSTIEYDGSTYGAYLAGDEPELDILIQHPTDTVMVPTGIKVYDLSGWPELEPVDTELEVIDFEEDAQTVDVVPIA